MTHLVETHTVDADSRLRALLPAALQQTLQLLNYTSFTPIQRHALPPLLEGKDVRAQAKTGSGKTAAFGLALLTRLNWEKIALQGLVLCPTRELADQVAAELRRLASTLPNLKILTIYGGVAIAPRQASLVKHPPHLIVGTPGRILDHFEKGHLDFSQLSMLVLDEADRLLDMGFADSINKVIDKLPKARQSMLFSATFPEAVDLLASQVLKDAEKIETDLTHDAETISQHFYQVPESAKSAALLQLLTTQQAQAALVFCNTRRDVQQVMDDLKSARVPALALHGDLDQRDRSEVLVRFANGSVRVLVATDVAARGLDLKALSHVISYELAHDVETHTHRIGRTGRAGESGIAQHLVSGKEKERLQKIGGALEPLPKAMGPKLLAPAAMRTFIIDAGKTDKMRAGDVLGALTQSAGLSAELIGKIEVTPTRTYVAVARDAMDGALKKLCTGTNTAKIKGRNFRIRLFDV